MKIGYIVASREVAVDRKLVGYMYREAVDDVSDSGWRVFSGEESQAYADQSENFAMYNAQTIVAIDPTIGEHLAAPAPIALERDPSGSFIVVANE